MTRLATIALALIACAAIAAPHHLVVARKNVAAGGWAGPPVSQITAWYDFADATDSDGTYDLTEINSPSYTNESGTTVGIGDVTGPISWRQEALDDNWGAVDTNLWVVVRFRPRTGIGHGSFALNINNGRCSFEYRTSSFGHYSIATSTQVEITGAGLTLDVWHTILMQYDEAGDASHYYLDTTATPTVSQDPVTESFATGRLEIGQTEVDVDFAVFGVGLLTADERAALYNAGATLTYATAYP